MHHCVTDLTNLWEAKESKKNPELEQFHISQVEMRNRLSVSPIDLVVSKRNH